MTHPNAFALKNSELNSFLFADVGTELNGSTLTILSMLARLGKDPWADAARLANLPKSQAFDYLTQSISKMPLGPEPVADMRATASRLLLLLPGRTPTTVQNVSATIGKSALPTWVPIALLCGSVIVGLILNMLPTAVSGIATPAPMAQSIPSAGSLSPMQHQ